MVTNDRHTFSQAMKAHKKIGLEVSVTVSRAGDHHTLTLTVGSKKRPALTDVPLLATLDDVATILADPAKVEKIAQMALASLDLDMDFLVGVDELTNGVQGWLPPDLARRISPAELLRIFKACDDNQSGYLCQPEMTAAVEQILQQLRDFADLQEQAADKQ